ncbi:MAG: hypothetical protein IJ685_04420 [Selenomonadaceae bacterium]|nr:hypothetical protein [Selenomonadaceae bacterium]
MPNQSMNLWDNPIYAWQQQLASGANLAKNLSPQALLGLTIGTGLGNWLGNKLWNWQRARDDTLQYDTNPVAVNPAINAAVQSTLGQQGDFDLGWKPQYQFPTANKLFNDAVTPNPQSWNWRDEWRKQLNSQSPSFFPVTTPTQNLLPTTATPNFDWRQNLRSQVMTPPPATTTTPAVAQTPQNPLPTTSNPWNNSLLNFGTLTRRY